MARPVREYNAILGSPVCADQRPHIRWLTKDGEEQSHSERLEQTTTFGCAGIVTYSCTSTYELHLANGDVQFQRGTFECKDL